MGTQVLRVALTGGPFGGKTEAWKTLRTLPDVLSIHETADSLYDCGFPRPADVRMSYDEWMRALRHLFVPARAQMQFALEEALMVQALRTEAKAIVTDRTILDGMLYYDDLDSFTRETGLIVDGAFRRYDIVFFFETVILHEDHPAYDRRMPAPLTREAHYKLEQVWKRHPGYRYIPVFRTLEEKVAHMRSAVSELL